MKSLLFSITMTFLSLSISSQSVTDTKPVKTLKKQEGAILSLAFQPDGKILASGSDDKTCLLWSFPEGKIVSALQGSLSGVHAILYLPDGSYVCTGGDRVIRVYKLSGVYTKTLSGPGTQIWTLSFNSQLNQIAAGSYDKTFKTIDFTSGKVVSAFEGHTKNALAVAFSPDGKLMASGSLDQTVKIWDVASKKLLHTCTGHGGNIYAVLFTNDSRNVISASNDNSIRIWDITTGKTIRNLLDHSKGVSCLAISPDGAYLLSGSFDTNIKFWEISSGECIATFSSHKDAVNTVAFHPDGKSFASGSTDKTIMIWDLSSELFVNHYFSKEFENEIAQSQLFAAKEKTETKPDYKARQEKAEAFRKELIQKYYQRYLTEIKGKPKK